MKIVELTHQLTDNHLYLNFDMPFEYQNKKVKIMIFPFDEIIPEYNFVETKKEEKIETKKFWFLELKGIDFSNNTFSREEMYDDWGR